MPIHAPHDHLYKSVSLEVAKAKLTHAGRKSLYAPLNLVAYIDMMTMLVIFLLMSFSATGEILFVQKNIVLPDAQNWRDLERSPVIGVSKNVEFKILKKIMYSISVAGYQNINFAVTPKAKGGGAPAP